MHSSLYQFIFILSVVLNSELFCSCDENVVTIHEGSLIGTKMDSLGGRVFHAFRGIPYAEPPVGDLRWKPPQPVKPWKGIRNASEEGSICPQFILTTDNYVGDEDCLFVNVYTHRRSSKWPVIVWVHGGGHIAGDGGVEENGPEFLMDHDIVLVTFNYRLGPLGFLSTGDRHLPGNYGLKDQVELLKWVKRNIKFFGGDQSRVTLFGYSSGAMCVHLHMLSNLSTNLYHRAVIQSGGAASPFSLQTKPLIITKRIADLVNCSRSSEVEMVSCLQKVSAESLVRTLYHFEYWGMKIPLHLRPVVENSDVSSPFLTKDPVSLLLHRKVANVPVITGKTSEENIIFAVKALEDESLLKDLDENFENIFRTISGLESLSSSSVLKIREFYLGEQQFKGRVSRKQLESFFSDLQFNYWTLLSMRLQMIGNNNNNVYLYNFTFQGRISDTLTINTEGSPYGVGHADDLAFTFRRKVPFPGGPNKEERLTIWRQGKFLANFAETGNPTPNKTKEIPVIWEPMENVDTLKYMEIGKNLKMVEEPLHGRYHFLDSIILQNDKAVDNHDEL